MDYVVELRKLERVNTSFDYGVELVVMAVKLNPDMINFDDDLKDLENKFSALFDYDRVCKKGFFVAKKFINDNEAFMAEYKEFAKQFRHDECVYAMEGTPTLLVSNKLESKKWFDRLVEELVEMIKNNGFDCKVNELSIRSAEIRIIPRV